MTALAPTRPQRSRPPLRSRLPLRSRPSLRRRLPNRHPSRRLAGLSAGAPATRPGSRRSSAARLTRRFERRPRLLRITVASGAATLAWLLAGPVAGGLAAGYATAAVAMLDRWRRTSAGDRARQAALEVVADLAADLRAGAPPGDVIADAHEALASAPAERVAVQAAWQVSEHTGAPLAEVLDRVEAQLRQDHRLRLAVAAHSAGAWATALLLAALPVAGVALGYGIGADPLDFLLHTPLGAGCAGLAGGLQLAGLVWTVKLSTVDSP